MGYKTLNLFFITHLHVEKQNRNNGYAKKLLKEIENKAVRFRELDKQKLRFCPPLRLIVNCNLNENHKARGTQ